VEFQEPFTYRPQERPYLHDFRVSSRISPFGDEPIELGGQQTLEHPGVLGIKV
jgi:hypothetical protein